MRYLRQIFPVFLIMAVVVSQSLAFSSPSGGGCPGVEQVEMCFDPSIRVTADGKGELQGKKCHDGFLVCNTWPDVPRETHAVASGHDIAPRGPVLTAPWKPPRLSA